MPTAADKHGSAFKQGTATMLARIVGWDGALLAPANFNSASSSSGSSGWGICAIPVKYTIYLLDDEDADLRTPVQGHENRPLEPSDVLFAALQLDDRWTVDETGYNFRHTPDICNHHACAVAGRRYLVEYVFTPKGGEHPVHARFRLNVI